MPLEQTFTTSKYLNLEYWFFKILEFFRALANLELPFGVDVYELYRLILSVAAVVAVIYIFYFWMRIYETRKSGIFDKLKMPAFGAEAVVVGEKKKNDRWQNILMHAASPNPSDWRLAIIEADTILDELLKKGGYGGENLGERLKNSNPNTFATLDYAWEAHKVRNKIAHEGSQFVLSQYETQRIISLFERVFKELGFI